MRPRSRLPPVPQARWGPALSQGLKVSIGGPSQPLQHNMNTPTRTLDSEGACRADRVTPAQTPDIDKAFVHFRLYPPHPVK